MPRSKTKMDADPEIQALRELYRKGLQQPGADGCPGDDALAALALGELQGEERVRTADHVVGCSRCSENVRLLLDLDREARLGGSIFRSRGARFAAAAAILLGLGLLLRGTSTPSRDEPHNVARGSAVAAPTPEDQASLARPPARLEWPSVLGATGYRLRLFDASADSLWESETLARAEVELPPDVLLRLQAGRSYFWTVAVDGPVETARLGPFWFHLEAR